MKLERGIPVAYLAPNDDSMWVHIRKGPSISSAGQLWMRVANECDYNLCEVGLKEESIEDVILSPSRLYIHCKLCRREGNFLNDSFIVTYSIAERRIIARIHDSQFISLCGGCTRSNVYSLVDGSPSDEIVKCILMFGNADGFSESWLASIDVFANKFILSSKLSHSFW